MITVFGIPNCDAMKRTFAWLDAHRIAYVFHSYKREGITAEKLSGWAASVGWDSLLNRRGTTWKRLAPTDREALDAARALQLMVNHPSLIRRPVIETPNGLIVGFDEAALLAAQER